ncbi:hypothetical protein D6779_00090 [Candidatus Parcubacteria bacterium]|nr:MAG: hypothetical protein D6779_00090 [Candidatus Parcubacteria bacterium]
MRIRQSTKRFASLLLGVSLFVGSLAVYMSLIRPAADDARQLKGELIAKQRFYDQNKKAFDQVKALIEDFSAKQKVRNIVALALPNEPKLSSLLVQIVGIAERNNLSLDGVNFSVGALSVQGQRGRSAVRGAKSALRRPLGTVKISTSLEGDYEDFKNFLYDIEHNLRILQVNSFSVSVELPKEQQGAGGELFQSFFSQSALPPLPGENNAPAGEEAALSSLFLPQQEISYQFSIEIAAYYQQVDAGKGMGNGR